jgi:LPS-assembly protein
LEYRVTNISKFIVICVFIIQGFFYGARSDAADGGTVQLDAEKISYEESSGIAAAEGSVRMTDRNFYATAPYLEYDSVTQQVTAVSTEDEAVTLFTQGKYLTGGRLDYNLETRRGKMSDPSGRADVFYVKGSEIEIMPESEAGVKRPVSGDEAETEDDMAAVWRKASLTTCSQPHPHYRLEAKKVTILPGRKLILHRPRAYLGSTAVMASPFDITLQLADDGGGKMRQAIFPRFGYESDKGAGLGLSADFDWGSGSLDIDVIGWTEGIAEGEAVITQQIGEALSVYGGVRREYDKDFDETEWRPRWGAAYSWKGWNVTAAWTRKELLSVEERAGVTTRHILERAPEIGLSSPWFADSATGGHFRFYGAWGRYEDVRWNEHKTYERSGVGAQIRGAVGNSRDFLPFYNVSYTSYFYDDNDIDSQEVLDARAGFLWRLGDVDMKTAYLRQWVWGSSPMIWDRYGVREDIYQEVGFTVPTKSPDYFWRIGVRAAYDIADQELAEMVYKVAYDQHCLIWEALYRDDRRGDDDWMGFTLSIEDLPHGSLRLFGEELADPFSY